MSVQTSIRFFVAYDRVRCVVVARNKKRPHSTVVGASLMSNKKVSSLVNKVRGFL